MHNKIVTLKIKFPRNLALLNARSKFKSSGFIVSFRYKASRTSTVNTFIQFTRNLRSASPMSGSTDGHAGRVHLSAKDYALSNVSAWLLFFLLRFPPFYSTYIVTSSATEALLPFTEEMYIL